MDESTSIQDEVADLQVEDAEDDGLEDIFNPRAAIFEGGGAKPLSFLIGKNADVSLDQFALAAEEQKLFLDFMTTRIEE